ncbi:MAG: chromosome partitioning protein [Blastocatellia bacterium AA13]|nr:MAG: chromosome partitioning protein [Blastocatellia bacterium AA13]
MNRPMSSPTVDEILEALRNLEEPDLKKSIVDLNLVSDVKVNGDKVALKLTLTTPACPHKSQLEGSIRDALLKLAGVKSVEIARELNLPFGSQGAEGKQGIPGIKNIVAVSSGKGGVGKSTVAVNLAVGLGKYGAKVGLLDTDVYGPNVPLMVGIDADPLVRGQKLIPHEAHGVKVMSIGFLNRGDRPVVWRGPMLHSAVKQFLYEVEWGDLDYLVVDMPPGTGDVQLSLAQLVSVQGAVLVTTPQEVAMADVRKAFNMFEQVQVPVLGIVENMSYFVCPNCSSQHEIFGSGGGRELASRFGTKLLGQIPLSSSIRETGDMGRPIVLADRDDPVSQAFGDLICATAAQVSILATKKRGLPVINIM